MDLTGKVVVITGAARSLGLAGAHARAAAGATVVLSDIDPPTSAAPTGASFLPLDVTSPDDWARAVASTMEAHGRIDGLVNNAALYPGRSFLTDEPGEDFLQMLDVNVRGPWLGIRAVIPAMTATGGSIVNLSSTSGLSGGKGFSAYGTTRWAVRGLSKHAATELAPRRIRVNSLHPHAVAGTGMFPAFDDPDEEARQGAMLPMRRLGTVDDVTSALVFLLSDASSYMTGREIVVDGGATLRAAL